MAPESRRAMAWRMSARRSACSCDSGRTAREICSVQVARAPARNPRVEGHDNRMYIYLSVAIGRTISGHAASLLLGRVDAGFCRQPEHKGLLSVTEGNCGRPQRCDQFLHVS